MTVLTEEIRKKYDAQQLATVQCRNYYFKSPEELENGFDSAQTAADEYPEVLKAILIQLVSNMRQKLIKL